MQDIYFESNYGKLYEKMDNGKIHTFVYANKYGKIRNMFLIRDIPNGVIDNIQYKDCITPYGYGGPIIEGANSSEQKANLISEYKKNFIQYAEENHIVSEFVRFHPIIKNALDFKDIYQVDFNRHTVGTDLTVEDPFVYNFSKSARKQIRRILRNPEITYSVEISPDTLDSFIDIYFSTMDRNNAESKYYFSRDYFYDICQNLKKHLLTVTVYLKNKPIAMGLYFSYANQYLHAHLSGTLSEYLEYSPAYILKYALMEYGKNHHYSYIHYGGGTTTSDDDSLFQFKKKFGQNTIFDFYVGKKIWQPEIYQAICQKKGIMHMTDFFPAYRFNEA